jgi:hypothetical protein
MTSIRPRLAGLAGAVVIVAWVLTGGAALVLAASSYPGYTCSGGSIPAGNYNKLTVTGVCMVDLGTVNVGENVDIKPGAELVVAFTGDNPAGYNLIVGDNINVGLGAVLILGCETEAFPCMTQGGAPVPLKPSLLHPTRTGALQVEIGPNAFAFVGGSLNAKNALAVVVHNSRFGQDVSLNGGGGGPQDCAPTPPPAPIKLDTQLILPGDAYMDVEDSWIGHNANVQNLNTCWSGFIRNFVGNDVNWNTNTTSDTDGNEIGWNWIGDNLNCKNNVPPPHYAPDLTIGNLVMDHATGQCVDLTTDSLTPST